MKTINRIGAQGDILFRRLDTLPAGAKKPEPRKGPLVLAHSETGHNHECEDADVYLHGIDDMLSVLEVAGDHADIVHKRAWDTHETIRLTKGLWEIRRQREYTPEGWRRVED